MGTPLPTVLRTQRFGDTCSCLAATPMESLVADVVKLTEHAFEAARWPALGGGIPLLAQEAETHRR
jgi:hypothetical protein